MRLGLAILGAVLAMGISTNASAERRVPASWAAPALEVTLLDGWRTRGTGLDLGLARATTTREAPEPGEELSLAVERMWSQVRAYRRRGGAELIVRGRF